MKHDRVVIHPSAKIAAGVEIGPWTVIGENVEIGEGCYIGPNVVIERNTKLGKRNKILQFASLGSDPQHLEYNNEETWLELGDGNTVREFVTLNRGTAEGGGVTKIGNDNYFMSCSHVAHDCTVKDHVIFANSAAIAGFVEVGHHAVLGAYSGVHQHVHIGDYSFLGRATKIYNDILPYMLVIGNPGVPTCINRVGLRRNGFEPETVRALHNAFLVIYRRGLKLQDARTELIKQAGEYPEIKFVIDAIDNTKRGIARHARNDE